MRVAHAKAAITNRRRYAIARLKPRFRAIRFLTDREVDQWHARLTQVREPKPNPLRELIEQFESGLPDFVLMRCGCLASRSRCSAAG